VAKANNVGAVLPQAALEGQALGVVGEWDKSGLAI
jgi:hypothetical protein